MQQYPRLESKKLKQHIRVKSDAANNSLERDSDIETLSQADNMIEKSRQLME